MEANKEIHYLLGYENIKIVQNKNMFQFSLDSVLLPNFVTLNQGIKNIMDIGCGNAPISLILSTKTNARITGVEIQKEVSLLAEESVALNGKENQIQILNQDIKELYQTLETDTYDVIVSNPPYFKVEEQSNLNDSPYKVISRHEVALTLEDIMIVSKKLLKNQGKLALVHRPDRLIDIITYMKKHNIEPKRVQFVHPKVGMDANIVLVEGSKNGKSGLKILPPILTHQENSEYTQQIQQYFESR